MKKITKREQKLDNIMLDLVHHIERFYGVLPLGFLEGREGGGDLGYCTFPKKYRTRFDFFDSFFQRLIEQLEPLYSYGCATAEAAEKIIGAALPKDEKVKRAWCEFHDAVTDQILPAQRVGFIVGVLVGAKFHGARQGELVRIADGLKPACLYRSRLVRSAHRRRKEDIDKAAKAAAVKRDRRNAFKLVEGGKKGEGHELLKGDFHA